MFVPSSVAADENIVNVFTFVKHRYLAINILVYFQLNNKPRVHLYLLISHYFSKLLVHIPSSGLTVLQ